MPELLRADAEIAARFDIADPYTFNTNLAGRGPHINDLAQVLSTSLELPPLSEYRRVVLVAHSMGGLVAKRIVANDLIAGRPRRIDRIVTFASPLLGAGLSSALSRLPGLGPQHQDLAVGSEFVNALGRDWAATEADRYVNVHHVIASDDSAVGSWSATAGYRYAAYSTLRGDHQGVVKPNDTTADSFQLLRKLLLDSKPPWHRGADPRHYEQPVLDVTTFSNSSLDAENVARFHYRSRALPFLGREGEWTHLNNFIGSTDPFRWMVLSAAGGVGKSRLALELCLATAGSYYAGFLPESERGRAWDRWQPLAPTLMVLDYATRNAEQARALLHALARRTMPGAAYPLEHPVRILLLVRSGDERSLNEDIVNRGDSVVAVKHTGAQKVLTLEPLADPWPIFKAVFDNSGKPLPRRIATLQALAQIDRKRRPLFAHLLADAMSRAVDGAPIPRNLDERRLLEDVIERWRAQFWRPACETERLGNGAAEETLLALATMCNGVPINRGRLPKTDLKGLLPVWRPHAHPIVFMAMTGKPSRETVPALEPDIVGEHFVVSQLSKYGEHERNHLIESAWRLDARAMAAFVDRISQDIEPTLENVATLTALFRRPGRLCKEALPFRAMLGVNLLGRLTLGSPLDASAILAELKSYADEHRDKTLQELWARGVINVLADLSLRDPQGAIELLAGFKMYTDAQGDSTLQELWALGAVNTLHDLTGHNADAAVDLLAQLKAYADSHGGVSLRKQWVAGAFNVVDDLSKNDPHKAVALLGEMKAYADAHNEAPLRELWAKGAVNVLNDLGRRDAEAASTLLAEMKQYAHTYGEAFLLEKWTEGVLNVVRSLSRRDPQRAASLLHATIADFHDEAIIETWAHIAYDVLHNLSARDTQRVVALLAAMRRYASTRSATPLREHWAKIAFTLLDYLYQCDPQQGLALLAEIRLHADTHDHESLRELWAMGAVNVLHDLKPPSSKQANALLAELKAYANTHGEAPLRELWAKGAFNVLHDLSTYDAPTAIGLLIEMKEFADTYGEAPLRYQWAKGAYNTLNDLGDSRNAFALLADMKSYADTHGEAPLRELWAKSAVNVLHDLSTNDRDVAIALYEQVATVCNAETTTEALSILAKAYAALLAREGLEDRRTQAAPTWTAGKVAAVTPTVVSKSALFLLLLQEGREQDAVRELDDLANHDPRLAETVMRIVSA
jgi:hypothetical protein